MKMKLFLPLWAILMIASCASGDDVENITLRFNQTWNVNESLERHKDGSLTYYAISWGGLVSQPDRF